MRALVIDPFHATVAETEVDGSLGSLQAAVGGPIELAMQVGTDDLYVQENGLEMAHDAIRGLAPAELAYMFEIAGGHQPFAGRGIVVGCDGNGNSAPAASDIRALANSVTFIAPSAAAAQGRPN